MTSKFETSITMGSASDCSSTTPSSSPPTVSPLSTPSCPKSLPIPTTAFQRPKQGRTQKNPKQQQQQHHNHRPALPKHQIGSLAPRTVLSPRPIQDLLIERTYLVDSLSTQGRRSYEFLLRLSALEQEEASYGAATAESPETAPERTPRQRRRLRKHISLLKSKIAMAAEQEKAIIVRLGELYVEMQSRERWAQVRLQSQQLQGMGLGSILVDGNALPVGYFHTPPEAAAADEASPTASFDSMNPHGPVVSVTTSLSPTSPVFVPSWSSPDSETHNPWPMPDVSASPEGYGW